MTEINNTERWFCDDCTALLGIKQGQTISIRYKQEINLIVEGKVTIVCRRCGRANVIDTCINEAIK